MDRGQYGAGERLLETFQPPICFAEMSAVYDSSGQQLTISDAMRAQLREYNEIPYRKGETFREFGMQGPRELVGAYKSAMLLTCVEWLDDHPGREPLSFERVVAACEAATPFNDLSIVTTIPYEHHPLYGQSDKTRLPYRPCLRAIDMLYDENDPIDWVLCRSFYGSFYPVQKFAAGVRADILGGSDFVPDKPTWENRFEQHTILPPQ